MSGRVKHRSRWLPDGFGVSFWGDENVLELELWLHNMVNVPNVSELYTLKW